MVRDHYGKLGFTFIEEREGGSTRWKIATSANVPMAPMTVVRAERTIEYA
jgi:hypothetical protein